MRVSIRAARSVLALLCLGLLASGVLRSQVQQPTPPAVEIRGSQVHHLTSKIVGQEYDLYVNLPRGYQDTTRSFPVIYLVDAQWDFPLVQAIYGQQYYDGFVPAAIIVGITWGGVNPNPDSLRARDFTPTKSSANPQSGGAPMFLSFIKTELDPYIASKFRTAKNDRTLMGSSLGGLFTLYALFHETAFFNRYVLTSPSVWWDNRITYSFEKEYRAKNARLPVRLFMGVGGLEAEMDQEFEKFTAQLRSSNYQDLQLETRVMENIGHSGSKAEGFTRGLQWVFAKPPITLPHEILKQYVGKYRVNPQLAFDIVEEQGRLVGVAPGNTRIPLVAATEKNFYVKGAYLFLEFKKDSAGKVTGFEVEQYAGRGSAQKVE